MYATWLADVLRAAGLTVREYPGWKTRGHGPLNSVEAVTWHHDASPAGPSPSVADYLYRGLADAGSPGDAQLWVDRAGVWHVLGAGRAWHAGKVLPGMPDNWTSLGVETDHTTGEAWPPAQLAALRAGTAAILRHQGKSSRALHFHKTICSPVGRKVDPAGLDLAAERAAVQAILDHGTKTAATTSKPARAGAIAATYLRPGQPPSWSVARYKQVALATHGVLRQAYYRAKYRGAVTSNTWDAFAAEVTRDLYTYWGKQAGDRPGSGWLSGDLSTPGRQLLARLGFEVK